MGFRFTLLKYPIFKVSEPKPKEFHLEPDEVQDLKTLGLYYHTRFCEEPLVHFGCRPPAQRCV